MLPERTCAAYAAWMPVDPIVLPARMRYATALYRLLPRAVRETPRIAHYASVATARAMPDAHALVGVDGSLLCLNLKHPADLQRAWGVWEPDLRGYFEHIVRPGMTVIDVGAHR